jgi:hypothetical protein
MKRCRPMVASIICIILTFGCATPPISNTTFSGTSAAHRQEKQGLEVQAETVTDRARLKDLFGEESLGNDTIAVHAQVKNLREGKTYIVQPQSFRLYANQMSNTGRTGNDSRGTQTIVGGALMAASITVGPIGLGPIAVPILLDGLSKQAKATVVKNNATRREFKSATLRKGESASGFLFFQIPKEQASEGINLSVSICEAGTTSCETFEFNLGR